jgi:hypothetical protein
MAITLLLGLFISLDSPTGRTLMTALGTTRCFHCRGKGKGVWFVFLHLKLTAQSDEKFKTKTSIDPKQMVAQVIQ